MYIDICNVVVNLLKILLDLLDLRDLRNLINYNRVELLTLNIMFVHVVRDNLLLIS